MKCCRALKHSEAAAFVPVEKKQNENSSFFSESELKAIGFLKYGKNVLVSRKASIYNPEQMVLGDNIRIDDFCILNSPMHLDNSHTIEIEADGLLIRMSNEIKPVLLKMLMDKVWRRLIKGWGEGDIW